MKLIEQSAEIWKQPKGEIGIYKQIEKAARLCYKSEDNTTEDSYKRFMNMLSEKGHNSPLEHGTVYLYTENYNMARRYNNNPYSKVSFDDGTAINGIDNYYITSNYRVLLENNWLDDLQYLCEPTEYHEERTSVHITTSRSISHELVRHRVFSFCQESQRYCNYSKDKFNNELTFITPDWAKIYCHNISIIKDDVYDNEILVNPDDSITRPLYDTDDVCAKQFLLNLARAEETYFTLLGFGWKPQQAREILPNATKTELIMTGFESQWREFVKLRCSSAAHPMMQELANKIINMFLNVVEQEI